jgi:hypothetical protein
VLARRLHPDRLGDATAAERALADRRMREVNESWRVLQDPASRRRYDQEHLLGSARGRPGGTGSAAGSRRPAPPARVSDDDDLVDVAPPMGAFHAGLYRHLPWVVLVVVFGVIFVVTAYATSDNADDPPAPAGAGSCVDVVTGPSTTIVPCSGPHELRIVRRVDDATACPPGTERRRLGTDGFLDCVIED